MRGAWVKGTAIVALCLLVTAGVALAQGTSTATTGGANHTDFIALTKPLLQLFVVATVMEQALSVLFNWRLYQEFFNGRAVKTLVMIAFGYAIVASFPQFDIIRTLASATASDALTTSLSALVLAGGSSAMYELFKRLGLRAPAEPLEAKPQPAEDKAWISVRIVPKTALGDVQIHFEKDAQPAAGETPAPPLAGSVGTRPILERLAKIFFAHPMRLPHYGGRTVEAGPVYRITATGRKKGAPGSSEPPQPFSESIYFGSFAGRSTIDFVREI